MTFAISDFSRSSLSPEVPSGEQQLCACSSFHTFLLETILFRHHRRYYSVLQGGMDVALSFPEACGVLFGTQGAWLDLFLQTEEQKGQTQKSQGSSLTTTTSYVSSKCMERTRISRLFRCRLRGLLGYLSRPRSPCEHTGRHKLFIVNVHFEPELTLPQLLGRLRLVHPHWPPYPNGVGIILV